MIKPVKSAREKMPYAERETPYEGAKEMLLVDPVEDREFLKDLLDAVWEDLPSKNKRPKKR